MEQPTLLMTSEKGGTVHTYPLTGGKQTYYRYLSCYLGNCAFFSNKEDALNHLTDIEP